MKMPLFSQSRSGAAVSIRVEAEFSHADVAECRPSASITTNLKTIGAGQIFTGDSLALNYNKPGLGPGLDPRTPDIVLKVNTGVIFTGGSKLSEHGGFNEDDIHTALLVAFPQLGNSVVKSAVSNQQVAPTIIKALGLDPNELEAVRKEQVAPLPFLFEGHFDNSVSKY